MVYVFFILQVRVPGETGLKGVIKGSGILCYCGKCKGVEVSVWLLFRSMIFEGSLVLLFL